MRGPNLKTPNGALEYTISYRARLKKRLRLELDEHAGLVVVAPQHWSRQQIRATLAQNTSRVERFLANARARHLPPLLYESGEHHYFLGQQYPLVIEHVRAGEQAVLIDEGALRVATHILQPARVKSSLARWYQDQARTIFSQQLHAVAQRAPWAAGREIPLQLRRMKRTWGNCSSGGVIKLNTHLVKAPLAVIDGVIAHELCHLEEMNHGKAFYALLQRINPGWREDRARLRAEGHVYLRT